MNPTHSYSQFFDRFNALEQQFWKQRLDEEMKKIHSFKPRFKDFDNKVEAILKEETPFYNLFDILNIRHYETKVHTPFLCHLLNPKASHQQGSLFLDTFLKQVLGLEFEYQHFSSYEIIEEHGAENGRIDIFIFFTHQDVKKSIVIENKIHAVDQPLQLERYSIYLNEVRRLPFCDYKLVYLTLDGKAPDGKTISQSLLDDPDFNQCLISISYGKDIVKWLMSCMNALTSAKVKFTLHQYIQTIE